MNECTHIQKYSATTYIDRHFLALIVVAKLPAKEEKWSQIEKKRTTTVCLPMLHILGKTRAKLSPDTEATKSP